MDTMIMRRFARLAAGLILGWPLVAGRAQDPPLIVSISGSPEVEQKLRGTDIDFLMEREGRIYIVSSGEDRRVLLDKGIPFVTECFEGPGEPRGETALAGGINGAYHSYRELEADLRAMETAYPGLARVYDIGDSLEGRNIYALKISDNAAQDEDESEVLFVGCHHAREWISVEVPFLLGRHLLEKYGTDPDVKRLVDRSEVWIIPLANPDGLEYSIQVYRYWRKNRRANADGSFGVDINRNYGWKWGYDNEGSSPVPESETYRGEHAFSEPETQAVFRLASQRKFGMVVSYHSFSQLIMYPWGYADFPADREFEMNLIAGKMAELIRSVNGRVYGFGRAASSLYLTNGDTVDWAHSLSGAPAFTVELPPLDILHGGFFNAEEDILSVFSENLPAMLYLIGRAAEAFESRGDPDPDRPREPRGPRGAGRPKKN